ncbi:hypothetical protein TIFTF001_040605 [Ficus carica]|uniref:Uncharacterized protein n=1 Tax=Ficus carica TaxID=3494 RepID=A0AA87ZHG0_FICCA|nr:hypothetical protein TIFTF001_040591 [Ficus carica]GMN24705.1 hypothetical protein TIFTF001_040605 [Ficus carica]
MVAHSGRTSIRSTTQERNAIIRRFSTDVTALGNIITVLFIVSPQNTQVLSGSIAGYAYENGLQIMFASLATSMDSGVHEVNVDSDVLIRRIPNITLIWESIEFNHHDLVSRGIKDI